MRTPDGRLAAVPELRHAGHQALAGRAARGRDPARFDARERLVVLPGDAKTGVKDPVIVHHDGGWHLWASCHPLADPGEADQMVTDYATSADGLDWTWHGTALSGRSGLLGLRGAPGSARCATRSAGAMIAAFYDGRASAAENYEERTGIATGIEPAALTAVGDRRRGRVAPRRRRAAVPGHPAARRTAGTASTTR